MPKLGRPQNPRKAEVLAWMASEDKGWKAAATHFQIAANTVKSWVRYENQKLRGVNPDGTRAAPVSAPAPASPAPVTRTQMEQVQEAVALRLTELCSPERVKAEATPVLVDTILKLATLFKLAPDAGPAETDGAEVLSIVRQLAA